MFRPAPPVATVCAAFCAVVCAAAVTASCRDVTAPQQDPTTVQYAAALNIRLSDFRRDTSGIYIQDVAPGSGNVIVPNASVNVNYTGNLANGRQFESNIDAATRTIVIGQNVPTRGFDRGLLGARGGGRRLLIVPPSLGYGNTSQGTLVPAGSVLVYTINVGTVTVPTTTTTSLRAAP